MLLSCGTIKTITVQEPKETIIEYLDGTQAELFVKANEWLVSTFKDASSVIEFSDKESGALIGKCLMFGARDATFTIYGSVENDNRVYAKIDIRVRANRAKISINPVSSWRYDPSGWTIYGYGADDFYNDADRMIISFEDAMRKENIDF